MADADKAATGISSLIHEWRADYTWYLRDGVPGVVFLLIIAIINQEVTAKDIEKLPDTYLIAGGIVAALMVPGIGFVLGGAAGTISDFISTVKDCLRCRSKSSRCSSQPEDTDDDIAWLQKNAPAAWEEQERLRSIGILMKTLCLLCVIAIVDWITVARRPFNLTPVALIVTAIILTAVAISGRKYHAAATHMLCKAHKSASKPASD